jgi:ABC-type bacteriocin/lantibiotic exporter with double-glycine peptidase domain
LLGQYTAMVVFKVIVTLSLLALGGMLVMREQMNLGQFVAAEIVILLLMNAVEKIILSIESVYDVLTALEKIGFVTDLPLERKKGFSVLSTDPNKGWTCASRTWDSIPTGTRSPCARRHRSAPGDRVRKYA